MSRVADELGTGASFGRARPVSARRAATAAVTGAPTEGVPDPTELPVQTISHNPDNPRDHLRNLNDMTQSVKELGVINAITVATVNAYLAERPERAEEIDAGARYLVIDGHRRIEAARRAGLATIRVMVDDARVATDESLLEAAFVANYHRDGMTELEEAHALESLVKFYGNQSKASQRLGMAQSTISSKLSFLKLSPELQADLADGRRTVEHVRNLGKLSHEEQRTQADARAEEARRAAEEEKARRTPPVQPVPVQHADGGESESAPSAAQQATPVSAPTQDSQRQRQRQPKPAESGESIPDPRGQPAEPSRQDSGQDSHEGSLPWGSGDAMAEVLIERMEEGDLRRLTLRLIEHNTETKGKQHTDMSA
ncbi:ParB/RepB/Spo0J family partition protein [Streptomyces lunaelactis]|uniref:ParB/RepB/Spo0J family partition protein n=1 Tax=Streptomyces lunaelactis TaxID=1535768 RepID=UPI001584A5D9|nr:ParB/RepB/Spo0J family partition protein [Streptomyces lunaelactis]NUL01668.1 ParB/RepB/Spo0J family partition protein [Streptomyces lunaelactis]